MAKTELQRMGLKQGSDILKTEINYYCGYLSPLKIALHQILKVAFHSRKFEFKVFSNIHLNDHNFRCTGPISSFSDSTDNE